MSERKRILPTEPGYYWYRDIDNGSGEAFEWEPKHVTRTDPPEETLVVDFEGVAELSGEWGPRIPDPEELQEKAETDAAFDVAIKRSVKHASDMIRDRLAEKFIVGLLAHRGVVCPTHPTGEVSDLVTDAYAIADAMLAERDKNA